MYHRKGVLNWDPETPRGPQGSARQSMEKFKNCVKINKYKSEIKIKMNKNILK